MGLFAERWAERKAGIGYPNVGWPPFFGAIQTATNGITVTQDKANTVSAWYAGIRNVSQDVSTLPLITYRRTGRNKERAYDHRLYRLFHDSPNPEMTSVVMRETLQAHLLSWGNLYCEKEVDQRGRLLSLWPLLPDRMKVSLENGKRKYEYQVKEGTAHIELDRSRVFHVPGFGFDGLIGYSLLTLARETLASAIGLREYGDRVAANDARPGVILTHPETLSESARKNLEASWNDKHGGLSNAGRTAVLEEGIEVTTLGLPRQDMLFIEGQRWQVSEVARWLRLAPHKLGDLERATFSNIEEQNIDHVQSTIMPWTVRWEQQINKDLVYEDGVFVEHLMDAALRGTTKERYESNAIAVQNLAMTPNEWRERENWNPVPWGDEPVRTPNNSADVDSEPALRAEEPKQLIVPVNIDVKSPDVHVSSPDVHVDQPEIRIEPPTVNVEPSQVTVAPADVTIDTDGLAKAIVDGYDRLGEAYLLPETKTIVDRDALGRPTSVTTTKGRRSVTQGVKRDEAGSATEIG